MCLAPFPDTHLVARGHCAGPDACPSVSYLCFKMCSQAPQAPWLHTWAEAWTGAGRAQPHAAALQTPGPPCKPGLANSSEADRSPPLWVALGDRLWGPEGLLAPLPVLPSIPGHGQPSA